MKRDYTVKFRVSMPEEYRLAELMGLKVEEDGDVYYKSFDGVNTTLFTAPPTFCQGDDWIEVLINWSKERGIELKSKDNSLDLVRELIGILEEYK